MNRKVTTVPVTLPHHALLEGDWADAFRTRAKHPFANARAVGETAFSTFPFWVNILMAIRNLCVSPFGLETGRGQNPGHERIGFFPLVSETADEVVVGLNDKHLDFRCVVDIANRDGHQEITISTIIARHNLLGRLYLAVILPFHRLILRVVMANLWRTAQNRPYP